MASDPGAEGGIGRKQREGAQTQRQKQKIAHRHAPEETKGAVQYSGMAQERETDVGGGA
jgi:hypothetical protein